MRYWAYLAAKLAGAAAPLYGVLALIGREFPHTPPSVSYWFLRNEMLRTVSQMAWFVVCVVAVYLIILDQRRRCRVCLRRLRMPVETGSWGRMLTLGRPRIESICPYGHGTLREEELQISGLENPQWTPHSDDIWEELCAPGKKEPGDQP